MSEVNFEFCEFIEWNMCFVTYHDFVKKREQLKGMYQGLDLGQKRFYKWYVYSHTTMNETYKNAIWEYLNFDDFEYLNNLLHLQTLLKR